MYGPHQRLEHQQVWETMCDPHLEHEQPWTTMCVSSPWTRTPVGVRDHVWSSPRTRTRTYVSDHVWVGLVSGCAFFWIYHPTCLVPSMTAISSPSLIMIWLLIETTVYICILYIPTHIHMYMYMYNMYSMYMHTIHTYLHTYVHMYMYMYMHTIHSYIHMYVHVYV